MTTQVTLQMRSVAGVEIFATGVHTDAHGRTDAWGEKQLSSIIQGFSDGNPTTGVPLKMGHTSDKFNQRVAYELGIPNMLVTGDHGDGQVRLGRVGKLWAKDGKLYADFVDVPEQVARLIEGGQYQYVSVEIDETDTGPILTAVALLGSEAPALGMLAPLSESPIYQGQRRGRWYSTRIEGDMQQDVEAAQGLLQRIWNRMSGARSEEKTEMAQQFHGMDGSGGNFPPAGGGHPGGNAPGGHPGGGNAPPGPGQNPGQQQGNFLAELVKMLGLPAQAQPQDILQAVQTLMQGMSMSQAKSEDTVTQTQPIADLQKQLGELKAANEANATQMKAQAAYITKLEHGERVATYRKQAESWTTVAGKPDELAEQLAKIEETGGKEVVAAIVQQYQMVHQAGMASAITQTIGRARPASLGAEVDPFEKRIDDYAKAQNIDQSQALRALSVMERVEFAEYNKRQKARIISGRGV